MKSLLPSKKQQALLEYIDGFIAEHNYAPSYREVMRALDYKSVSTVASHIDGLIERGWLVKRDNSARSVEVVYKKGEGTLPSSSLPNAHQEWLYEYVVGVLKDNDDLESKRTELTNALQTLKLTDLAERVAAVSRQVEPEGPSSPQ